MQFDLTSVLFTKEIAIIAAGIFAVLHFAGMIPVGAKRLVQTKGWHKVLPVLPMVLGIVCALLPGVIPLAEGQTVRMAWGNLVLVGIWAGLVAAHGRKLFKRLLVEQLPKAPKEGDLP